MALAYFWPSHRGNLSSCARVSRTATERKEREREIASHVFAIYDVQRAQNSLCIVCGIYMLAKQRLFPCFTLRDRAKNKWRDSSRNFRAREQRDDSVNGRLFIAGTERKRWVLLIIKGIHEVYVNRSDSDIFGAMSIMYKFCIDLFHDI